MAINNSEAFSEIKIKTCFSGIPLSGMEVKRAKRAMITEGCENDEQNGYGAMLHRLYEHGSDQERR